jgi:hypothetical protein
MPLAAIVAAVLVVLAVGAALGTAWYFRDDVFGMITHLWKSEPPAAKPVVDRFAAEPATITVGQDSRLMVSVRNADIVMIDFGIGIVKNDDQITVHPGVTTTYTLTASGKGGSETQTVVVTVNPAESVVPPPKDPVIEFSADRTTIERGQSVNLSWQVSNAADISIDNGIGTVADHGQRPVQPAQTTTYTLTAGGPAKPQTQQVTITVQAPSLPPPPPPPTAKPFIESFTVSPGVIDAGQTVTLAWSVRNAPGVMIDQGIGTFGPQGQITVRPLQTTVYTLHARGPGGDDETTVRVTVNAPPPVVTPPAQQPQSGVFRCPNRPVYQNGQVVFENLPDRKVQLHYDQSSWRALIFRRPNGTRQLVLISLKPGVQTGCEVQWETVN